MPIALYALTIAAYAIGTTEFVIVGLLPTVATDLRITLPLAGLIVSVYALGVTFGAPILTALTGRIDLVHCNDSRDAAGSGADRHANFGTGQIDPDLLVAVVRAADAPVICETAEEGRKDDIAFLRDNISD